MSEFLVKFDKSSKEEVRASVEEFRGRPIVNIRVFYRDEAGEWKPGKQGLALSVDRYRDLASMVLEIGEELKRRGLIR